MKNKNRLALIYIFFTSIFSNFLYANGASFYPGLNGKNAIPYNIHGVQLISESIHISRFDTVCKFKLLNLNKKKVNFKMGFPFNIPNSNLPMKVDAEMLDKVYKINEFKVTSGSQEKKVELKINGPEESNTGIIYGFVMLWDESFNPGEEKEVACKYKTIWSWSSSDFGTMLFSTSYIRETAKYWEDKILEAHFYIHLDGLEEMLEEKFENEHPNSRTKSKAMQVVEGSGSVLRNITKIEPENYFVNLKDKTIEWHEYNVKEMKNIDFKFGITEGYSENFRNTSGLNRIYDHTQYFLKRKDQEEVYSKESLKIKIQNYKDVKLFELYFNAVWGAGSFKMETWEQRIFYKLMRNYYYALHGKKFDDAKLNDFYSKVLTPKEIIPGDLTDVEKNNVEMIKEYEDKVLYNFENTESEALEDSSTK